MFEKKHMKLEEFINLNEEQLLIALVSDEEKVAFSKKGSLARGMEIFNYCLGDTREMICKEYQLKKSEINTILDAANIAFVLLTASSQIASGLIVPFSVLVAKYGLDKVCSNKELLL